jgi:hypothetical protein
VNNDRPLKTWVTKVSKDIEVPCGRSAFHRDPPLSE